MSYPGMEPKFLRIHINLPYKCHLLDSLFCVNTERALFAPQIPLLDSICCWNTEKALSAPQMPPVGLDLHNFLPQRKEIIDVATSF